MHPELADLAGLVEEQTQSHVSTLANLFLVMSQD